MRLLAAREHSRAELVRKLCAKAFAEEAVSEVLDELGRQGLQSDERFTEQYIDSRRQRGFGPLRIRVELQERGVADELVAALLDERDEAWLVALRGVHDKKYGDKLPQDFREQAKRARFLNYRGFSAEQVRCLLQQDD